MIKRKMIIVIVLCLVLVSGSVLYAGNVLRTGMHSPLQIVKARKYIMQVMRENMTDMSKKFDARQAKEAAVNAGSIAAMAQVLPPLYRGIHKQVYPSIKGSIFYFKGVPGPGFEAQSKKLWSAAAIVKKSVGSNQPMQLKKFIGTLQESCKTCHAVYRGKI